MVLIGYLFTRLSKITIESAIACQQIQLFFESENRAVKGTTAENLQELEFVTNYYPSGSRLEKGGRFDRLVESARAEVAAHIISHIEFLTGNNLGNDPVEVIKFLNNNSLSATNEAAKPRSP